MLLGTISKNLFGKSSEKNIIVIIFLILGGIIFEWHENSPEQIIKYGRIETNSYGKSSYRGDSKLNIFGDIMSNILGLYIAYNYSNNFVVVILIILFILITWVLGFSYWTDFFKFMFV